MLVTASLNQISSLELLFKVIHGVTSDPQALPVLSLVKHCRQEHKTQALARFHTNTHIDPNILVMRSQTYKDVIKLTDGVYTVVWIPLQTPLQIHFRYESSFKFTISFQPIKTEESVLVASQVIPAMSPAAFFLSTHTLRSVFCSSLSFRVLPPKAQISCSHCLKSIHYHLWFFSFY